MAIVNSHSFLRSAFGRVRSGAARGARDTSGAAMIEYALLVGLIAVAAIVGITATGTSLTAQFAKISCKISNPTAACSEPQ